MSLSRRTFLSSATGVATAMAMVTVFDIRPAQADTIAYTPAWASVDQHTPAPEWFQDAKFGIYFHWGAFSVPAYSSEWYPRNMYISGSDANTHHIATYGDPSVWPYNNFIDGGTDLAGNHVQFAPKLTSAGGNFDPVAWAQLFKAAGARFAGPVAEHHDGFSMWDSKVNEWTSVGKGLKLLVAMHHAYHFNGYYDHVPAQTTASLQKLYGQLGTTAENQLWYDKLKEVLDEFQPDILWEDFDLVKVDETQRLNFLSYYYNQAETWGADVVATYKDGYDSKGEVYDYERGGPGDLTTPYWLTDDAISSSSWSYTVGIGYYTLQQMLHSLIDRVSKSGNMLLNISGSSLPCVGRFVSWHDERRTLRRFLIVEIRNFARWVRRVWEQRMCSGGRGRARGGRVGLCSPGRPREGGLGAGGPALGAAAPVRGVPGTGTPVRPRAPAALAVAGRRVVAGLPGGRPATGDLRRARGGDSGGALGAARRRAHPGLRRTGGLVRRRSVEEAGGGAAADQLAHGRRHRDPGHEGP
jgi:hypothetical protein